MMVVGITCYVLVVVINAVSVYLAYLAYKEKAVAYETIHENNLRINRFFEDYTKQVHDYFRRVNQQIGDCHQVISGTLTTYEAQTNKSLMLMQQELLSLSKQVVASEVIDQLRARIDEQDKTLEEHANAMNELIEILNKQKKT